MLFVYILGVVLVIFFKFEEWRTSFLIILLEGKGDQLILHLKMLEDNASFMLYIALSTIFVHDHPSLTSSSTACDLNKRQNPNVDS